MMIVWSPHTEDPGALARVLPKHDRFRALTDYLASPIMRKEVGGRVVEIVRNPPPEVLRGDEQLLRLTLQQQTSKRKYSVLTLSFAREDIDVAAFNAGEPQSRRLIDLALTLALETAFAGIPPEARPHIFVTTHTHAARVEVNVALPRGVRRPDGSVRAHNPHPPRRGSLLLWDATVDVLNHAFGLADPGDPAWARLLVRPDHLLKREAEEHRAFTAGLLDALPSADPRLAIAATVAARVAEGAIRSRADVLATLADLIRPEGWVVLRAGRESVTIGVPEAAPPERLELRGPHFAASFTSPAALVGPHNLAALRAERARVLGTAPERLQATWAARAQATRAHLGQGAWPEVESPDALLATIVAAGRSYRQTETSATRPVPSLRIPSRHHSLPPARGVNARAAPLADPASAAPTISLAEGAAHGDHPNDAGDPPFGAEAPFVRSAPRPYADGAPAPRAGGAQRAGGAAPGGAARDGDRPAQDGGRAASDAAGQHGRHHLALDHVVGRLARPGGAERLLSLVLARTHALAQALAPHLTRTAFGRLIPPGLTGSLSACTHALERLHDQLVAFDRSSRLVVGEPARAVSGRRGAADAAPDGERTSGPSARAPGGALGGGIGADRGGALAPLGSDPEPHADGGGDGADRVGRRGPGADRGRASGHPNPPGGAGPATRGHRASNGDDDGLAGGRSDAGGDGDRSGIGDHGIELTDHSWTDDQAPPTLSPQVRPAAGSLAARLRRLHEAARAVVPGARPSVRPAGRTDGMPGPSSVLTLRLPGLPLMLWSGATLTFASHGATSPALRRVLDQIAAQLRVASVHLSPAATRPTLIVVADASSRVRFANWLASQPGTDLSRVEWLVLNGAVRDLDGVVAAIQQRAKLSSSAELVFVLSDPERPGEAAVAATLARIVPQLQPEIPVVVLRPAPGGYEEVERDPTASEVAGRALLEISDDQHPVGNGRGAAPQDVADENEPTPGLEAQLDVRAELEAGPRPWRS